MSSAVYLGADQSADSGKFRNSEHVYRTHLGTLLKAGAAYWRADRSRAAPGMGLPWQRLRKEDLPHGDQATVLRLGHSSMLIHVDGQTLLTDPVFSERASPVQWAGPRRFHPVPIVVDDLPRIKAVIISHDHYDHLDRASVLALDAKVEYFVTPLRVGAHLRRWGIAAHKIIELDWWQSFSLGSISLTATPAQHFSGRGLFDRDRTLWASWVIESTQARLFFSGDSGYFGGFRDIGERFGPFDLTMIETGAYHSLWSEIHMLPEQSIDAHLDLRGKAMLPIHNSTFDLAIHDWDEPLERASQLAQQRGVQLVTPMIGEPLALNALHTMTAWWRESPQLQSACLALQAP